MSTEVRDSVRSPVMFASPFVGEVNVTAGHVVSRTRLSSGDTVTVCDPSVNVI